VRLVASKRIIGAPPVKVVRARQNNTCSAPYGHRWLSRTRTRVGRTRWERSGDGVRFDYRLTRRPPSRAFGTASAPCAPTCPFHDSFDLAPRPREPVHVDLILLTAQEVENDPVLPQRQPPGVFLSQRRHLDVTALEGVVDVNAAQIARIDLGLDLF